MSLTYPIVNTKVSNEFRSLQVGHAVMVDGDLYKGIGVVVAIFDPPADTQVPTDAPVNFEVAAPQVTVQTQEKNAGGNFRLITFDANDLDAGKLQPIPIATNTEAYVQLYPAAVKHLPKFKGLVEKMLLTMFGMNLK